ncbi:MAG: amidohydrolase family protein, partial [Deltaproteobacteria bacterium]|nr:amidohydrolase family protein [Deltaproteobacteria bacterium]
MIREMILKNGHFITVTGNNIERGAIRIIDGKIDHIFHAGQPVECDGFPGIVRDLNGAAVLPGFIDSHMHLVFTGFSMGSVDLSQAKSIDHILQLVRAEVGRREDGAWVFGSRLIYPHLKEKRNPIMEELDQVSPKNQVWLVSDTCHSSVVNSIGF